ncbi:MAG: Cys-Xaa-Xaa-Xaa repeat radical SAM target protein [Paludibacteraceae bacterium]|nr:Cys-Xaa-Xaa-Xaa repeat radical SAM target protein [Paludibacteraceae bacterium]
MDKFINDEELQSRREFFKKAAKAALPVVGAVVLSTLPMVSHASTVMGCPSACKDSCAYDCTGCSSCCQGGCKSTCSGTCHNSCSSGCKYHSKN